MNTPSLPTSAPTSAPIPSALATPNALAAALSSLAMAPVGAESEEIPSGEVTTINVPGVDLHIADYKGGKSFLVWGLSTIVLSEALKALSGRPGKGFQNPSNPTEKTFGWIFGNRNREAVDAFLQQIQAGAVVVPAIPEKPTYAKGRKRAAAPKVSAVDRAMAAAAKVGVSATVAAAANGAVPAAASSASYSAATVPLGRVRVPGQVAPLHPVGTQVQTQTVTYTVVRPTVGMRALINVKETPPSVIETRITHAAPLPTGVIQDVFVAPPDGNAPGGDVYRLGIVNGNWQVIGFLTDHTVIFSP